MQSQRITRVYPPGAMLFRRSQVPKGVFYLQEGAVHLSSGAASGEHRTAEPPTVGSLLGLSELFSEKKYESSAPCRSLTRVIYVERDDVFAIEGRPVHRLSLRPGGCDSNSILRLPIRAFCFSVRLHLLGRGTRSPGNLVADVFRLLAVAHDCR